jgi:hypothetical protein
LLLLSAFSKLTGDSARGRRPAAAAEEEEGRLECGKQRAWTAHGQVGGACFFFFAGVFVVIVVVVLSEATALLFEARGL